MFTYGFTLKSCTLTFTEFFNDVRGGEIPNFRVRTYARTWICQALVSQFSNSFDMLETSMMRELFSVFRKKEITYRIANISSLFAKINDHKIFKISQFEKNFDFRKSVFTKINDLGYYTTLVAGGKQG